MDRRNFFKLLMLGAVGGTLPAPLMARAFSSYAPAAAYTPSYLVNCFNWYNETNRHLTITDIHTMETLKVPIHFIPHTITRVSEDVLVCSMKKGPFAASIDLKKGKVLALAQYAREDKREFMGHALYDPQKNALLMSEQVIDSPLVEDHCRGLLTIRDPISLKILGETDSGGRSPHDLVFASNGQVAVCNSSANDVPFLKYGDFWKVENRNVAFLDPVDLRPLKRLEMPNSFLCPSHLKVYGDKLVVSGIYSHYSNLDFLWQQINWSPVVFDKEGRPQELMPADYVQATMNGEHLSIAINHELEVVAMTVPIRSSVNLWSLKDGSFLAHYNFLSPKGILVHPLSGEFVVATGTGLHTIHPVTFKQKSLGRMDVGNGLSHFYVV